MNTPKFALALLLLISSALAVGQESASGQVSAAGKPVITGVWRGQMNNLPVVVLVISDEGSGLSGAALFYMWRRDTVNDPFTASSGIPEPMLNPTFDGKTLQFKISHRRAHPPRTLSDPPIHFHLTLMGSDKAEFVNDTENQGPALVLSRSDF
jgi:hypothetical protein